MRAVWIETPYGLVNASAADRINTDPDWFEESQPPESAHGVRVGDTFLGPFTEAQAQAAYESLRALLTTAGHVVVPEADLSATDEPQENR